MHILPKDPDDMPLPARERSVIVHCGEGWLSPVADGAFDFFTRLESHAFEQGWELFAVAEGGQTSRLAIERGGAHLMIGAPARYRAGVLHVAPSYLWGFWYLDQVGVYWQSSTRLADFPGESMPWEPCQFFFDGVAGHMLGNNVSKRPQPEREGLQEAVATVFCQEIEGHWPRSHYLTTEEIIRNAARAAGGGIVYVKCHPDQSEVMRGKIEALCEKDPNLRLSEASVHDLVAASGVVITQNSAAGFEALLQHKPVVTCAKADYHHATLTARNEDQLRQMIREAPQTLASFEYHRYVTWFLAHRCLEPQKEDFASRAWARIMDSALPM